MKQVVYEDKHKVLRRVLLRDEDDPDLPEYGIPVGPSVIDKIDWDGLKRDINNLLVRNNVETRTDLQGTKSLDGICVLVKRAVDDVFREKATEDKLTKSR